ncbi:hypothetical protein A9Q83_11475 [Alphaproteobacteria bacterium 46_93_T64]|nr:hypothetical protein A9Q83_11475 [Alphaproteobacteria bacterium 46_93_T64]
MDDRIFITFDDMENLSDLLVEAGVASSFERSELHSMWLHLQNALKDLPPGNLERSKSLELFSLRRIDDAIELEWRLIGMTTIYPGMKSAEFTENIDKSPNYKKAMMRIKVWKALKALICEDGPEKSGWLIISQDKKGRKALQLRWREDIKVGWGGFVVVTLDATQDEQVVSPYFDRPLQQLPSSNVALEHVSVLQVVDRSFGASSLIPDGGKDDQRRKNRAWETYQWIWLRAIQYRGQSQDGIDVLVVCQLGLEELFRAWGLPDNVDITHFNALRGLDNWGGVACQITIGRLMPKPTAVEDIAEALTGRAVDKRLSPNDWYPKQTVGIRLADGSGWAVENDRHPDPLAEKIRYQICEGELIQAIGRSRGVNRSPETPLQIDILTNVCLLLVVHQPIRWAEHAPGIVEAMLSRGLMVGSFKDAAVISADLFPTEDAARKAVWRRSKILTSNVPIPDIPHYVCTIWGLSGIGITIAHSFTPALATFRRGERSTVIPVIFDPHRIDDPAAWLSSRLDVDVQVITGPEANVEWAIRQKRKAGRK